MSIQFACPMCGDLVRTSDAMAGRRGKCPHCDLVFTIPFTSTHPASPTIALDGKLEFTCESCGQLVRVPVSAAGKRGQCPHCQVVGVIPEAPPHQSQSSVAETPQGDLEFQCPRCNELVRTSAASAGKKGMCPHCEKTFTIPTAEEAASRLRTNDLLSQLTLDSEDSATINETNEILNETKRTVNERSSTKKRKRRRRQAAIPPASPPVTPAVATTTDFSDF